MAVHCRQLGCASLLASMAEVRRHEAQTGHDAIGSRRDPLTTDERTVVETLRSRGNALRYDSRQLLAILDRVAPKGR